MRTLLSEVGYDVGQSIGLAVLGLPSELVVTDAPARLVRRSCPHFAADGFEAVIGDLLADWIDHEPLHAMDRSLEFIAAFNATDRPAAFPLSTHGDRAATVVSRAR